MPTTNRSLETPARGSNVGTWDTPVNANSTIIDQLFGSVTTVSLASTNVTLSTSQCQNAIIRLTGALAANVAVIFPTVQAIYTVENLTTGNFTVTCRMASGQSIAIPQGLPTQIFTDGTNTKFLNNLIPGTFWDYAGTTTPSWVTACTVKPWLLCDGTVYNIADYPYLAAILGSTWGGDGSTTFAVPDLRNRVRASVGGGRITAAGSGVNGAVVGAVGGSETVTLTRANLPNIAIETSTIGDHQHTTSFGTVTTRNDGSALALSPFTGNDKTTSAAGSHSHIFALNGGVTQTVTNNLPPIAIFGVTLIKT